MVMPPPTPAQKAAGSPYLSVAAPLSPSPSSAGSAAAPLGDRDDGWRTSDPDMVEEPAERLDRLARDGRPRAMSSATGGGAGAAGIRRRRSRSPMPAPAFDRL
jgi:hypothetical protein